MSWLLSLIAGPNSIFLILGGAIIAFFAHGARQRAVGARKEREKHDREKLAMAEDRLEMDREATEAERRTAGMTDAEAQAEALKWAKR